MYIRILSNIRRFIIEEVTEDDLEHMSLEIVVVDKGRLRTDQPMGKVLIGPDQVEDSQHWEDMIRKHGHVIRMMHAIKDP